MTFRAAVRSCFSNYVNFEGRAPRSEYWYFILMCVLAVIAAIPVAVIIGWHWVIVLLLLGTFLPHLAVAVRRLHDTDASGWWYLLVLFPYVGSFIFIVWFCLKGTRGENRFGPDPLDRLSLDTFD